MGLYDRDYMRREKNSGQEFESDPEKKSGRGVVITALVIIVLAALVIAYIF